MTTPTITPADLDETSVWTIVVAGGTGSRFGTSIPKQFLPIGGRPVVEWSLRHAAEISDGLVVVLPAGVEAARLPPETIGETAVTSAVGGASRSESVRAGLALVPSDATVILVHDAARPLASADLFRRVAEAVVAGADAVIPAVAVTDTIRTTDGRQVDRSTLRAVQTPQGFSGSVLRAAYGGAEQATDDATLVSRAGATVVEVEGERWNIKLTEPADEAVIADLLLRTSQTEDMNRDVAE